MIEGLAGLEPIGVGNPGLMFVSYGVEADDIQLLKGKHLKFRGRQNDQAYTCIAFGMAEHAELVQRGPVDILYRPSLNEWRGRVSIQCEIKDIRRTQQPNEDSRG